jgi:hypothetical protein
VVSMRRAPRSRARVHSWGKGQPSTEASSGCQERGISSGAMHGKS